MNTNLNLTLELDGIEEDYFNFFKSFFVSFIETLDPNIFEIAHLIGVTEDNSYTLFLSFGKNYFDKEHDNE